MFVTIRRKQIKRKNGSFNRFILKDSVALTVTEGVNSFGDDILQGIMHFVGFVLLYSKRVTQRFGPIRFYQTVLKCINLV